MRNLFKIPWSKPITACLAFIGFLLISYEIHAEASEIGRDGRFIAYDDGTVLDTRTDLMWAAEDNRVGIDWLEAKRFCENYRGGGYRDWRMPTQDELAGLYDQTQSRRAACGYAIHVATKLIDITCYGLWASETRGIEAAHMPFYFGFRYWTLPSKPAGDSRVLPVRSAKGVEVTTSRVNEKVPEKVAMASTLAELKDPYTGMEFVFIKGGCFEMGDTFGDGDSDEKPVHQVCVDDFYLGKYEVRVGDFRRFVNETGYRTEAESGHGCNTYSGLNWGKDPNANWWNPGFAIDDRHPVVCVSWNDSMAFIDWLKKKTGKQYRLPTEAEWEYAGRNGGKQHKYSWGNGDPSGNIADESAKRRFFGWTIWNEYDDGYIFTAPVGSFRPNELGLYDMTGNVWEWCSDWYGGNYYQGSPRNNPQGPGSGSSKVLRGGSWDSSPRLVRAAYRLGLAPSLLDLNDAGFRLGVSAQ